MRLDRGARGRFDLEAKFGGEAHRAHHPHRILAHPQFGLADGADEARAQIVARRPR